MLLLVYQTLRQSDNTSSNSHSLMKRRRKKERNKEKVCKGSYLGAILLKFGMSCGDVAGISITEFIWLCQRIMELHIGEIANCSSF